jgi:hypothetical protein
MLLKLVLLVLFRVSSYECILYRKDTDDVNGDFMVDNHLVFADNINVEFLTKNEINEVKLK